ncbi:cation/H(+) antiporter 20-like [Abrus precatorius]|uniref:Cation/H(+) antiporter 20-like n=1 Tax=Abrus precatorius TaxID=3816 RepID=A0A8B8MCE8_ABRPR|nr:cation/H(+) antiporter 20-like [Abrus precatorius]
MVLNITSIKTSSNGAWQGDNPLHFAFPLLILQITLIIFVSRSLSFLLKPLRQPKVIAEILGGIVLGPSVLGRNKKYMHRVFPTWSTPLLESVASIGLLFFLFLVGLELDLVSIRRSGRKALSIAVAGMSIPFASGIGLALVFRKTVDGADKIGFAQFIVFIGVAISITAFAVLARILAELKLLTSKPGGTAMAAAALNDVAAWILLALAIALAGDGDNHIHKSPLVSVWVLLSGAAFVVFMMVAIKPAMEFIAGKCSPANGDVDENYVCLTLMCVLVFGFVTDLIGIHSVFGAFVFGLTVPKGVFAERLIVRVEDFVVGLLLPLYFASSGLKTNVATIKGAEGWGLLALVIATACAGKIVGTFVVAVACKIPTRESLTIAVLMNTKGLVELIVLNIGKEKKVLNDEMFAILVLMALFTTFITTPLVMSIYKPSHDKSSRTLHKLGDNTTNDKATNELQAMACVHGPNNVPSTISFIESCRGTNKSSLKLFIVHLVELTERPSSIVLAQNVRKNGSLSFNRSSHVEWLDQLYRAFKAHSQLGQVSVRSTTVISPLSTVHEDICHVADDKMVTLIILPFHKRWRKEEMEEEVENNEVSQHQMVENIGHGWRSVNQRVLKNAPCSVAVLVDRGYGNGPHTLGLPTTITHRVCILFFGGPDDREALELGNKISNHPSVKVTVVRFVQKYALEGLSPSNSSEGSYNASIAKVNLQKEKELDDTTMAKLERKWCGLVNCVEKVASNVMEDVVAIGRSRDYDLIIVGKGRFPSSLVADLKDREVEHEELGPIGDILASSTLGVVSSVLVIQQHDVALDKETPLPLPMIPHDVI